MSLSAAVTAQFRLIVRAKCASNQWSAGCVFHLSTAALGYFLILVVALAQIPLLHRILQFKHDKALINHQTIGMMALVASTDVAYAVNRHLPVSTWGEAIIRLVQYLIIINLLLIHQGQHRKAVAFTLFYVTAMVGSLTPAVSPTILGYLKVFNILVGIFQKVVTMYRCHRQGTPVHPVVRRRSLALLNLCAVGRLLTACFHARDTLLVSSYVIESVGSLALTTVVLVTRIRNLNRRKKTNEQEEESKRKVKTNLDADSDILASIYSSSSSSSGGSSSAEEMNDEYEGSKRSRRRRTMSISKRKLKTDTESSEDTNRNSGGQRDFQLSTKSIIDCRRRKEEKEEKEGEGDSDMSSSCDDLGSFLRGRDG